MSFFGGFINKLTYKGLLHYCNKNTLNNFSGQMHWQKRLKRILCYYNVFIFFLYLWHNQPT